ncbi:PAS domain-containing protein [Muricoccus nepalensis]|uniref:PAS domain-containing protein n=1 Tax=Muricoccus nepalensis TaxID=1854500 RepID=UPI001F4F60F3|nr:PAS domain-containing protein [Roseomonas nepalensis]
MGTKRHRLRFRVLLATTFAVLALGAAGTAALLAQRETTAALREDAGADLAEAARGLAELLDRGLFERWRDVQVAAALGAALRDPASSSEAKRTELRRLRETFPDYALVMFVSPEGRVVASDSGLVEGVDVSRREYFLGGREGPFAGDVHDAILLRGLVKRLGQPGPRPQGTAIPTGPGEPPRFVDVATPVRGSDGALIGVMAAHLFWEWAEDVEASVLGPLRARRPGAEGFIIAADGSVLLGPAPWRGGRLTPVEGSAGVSALQQIVATANKERSHGHGAGYWPDPGRVGARVAGSAEFIAGWAPTGGHGGYGGLGWTVVARQEAETALAPARQLRNRILLWGAAAAVAAALLGWMLANRLARPIEALAGFSASLDNDEAGRPRSSRSAGSVARTLEEAALTGALSGLAADRDVAAANFGRAREKQLESEAFLRSVLDASTDCLKVVSLDGRLEFMNANGCLLMEIDNFEAVRGSQWASLWPEQTRERVRQALATAAAGGEERFEAFCPTAKGAPRWWDVAIAPVRDPAGQIVRAVCVARDITARQETDERLQLIVESAKDYAIFTTDHENRIVDWLAGAEAVFGWAANEVVGHDAALLHAPEERETRLALEGMEVAQAAESVPNSGWHVRKDGQRVFIDGRVTALRDPSGALRGYLRIGQDVSDRRAAEERSVLLMREVDHRAKNALAVVSAALRLTRAPDLQTYIRVIEGRVAALARAQTLLAQDRWTGADLGALLRGELVPFLNSGRKGGPWVEMDGPTVVLPASAAQPLAMVVHELATNALKYGALSSPNGSVSITWRLEGGPQGILRLLWTERGGPMISVRPQRRGFGSRVLEGTVRDQLGGAVSVNWHEAGLSCELAVPLVRRSLSDGEPTAHEGRHPEPTP